MLATSIFIHIEFDLSSANVFILHKSKTLLFGKKLQNKFERMFNGIRKNQSLSLLIYGGTKVTWKIYFILRVHAVANTCARNK